MHALHIGYFTWFSQQAFGNDIITSIMQMKKLDSLGVEQLSQNHPGGKQGAQNLKTNRFPSSHTGFINPVISDKHVIQKECLY